MANISFKPKPQDGGGIGSAIGGLTGAALGFFAGGPAGASLGMSLGSGAGKAAEVIGGIGGQKQETMPIETNDSAIGRRIAAVNGDNLQVLKEGILALPEAPPEIRAQFAEPLLSAFQAERQKRGRV